MPAGRPELRLGTHVTSSLEGPGRFRLSCAIVNCASTLNTWIRGGWKRAAKSSGSVELRPVWISH